VTDPEAPHRRQDWSWKSGSDEKRANMEAYVEWLLTPEGERRPSTKQEFADLLGVSRQTLFNYSRDPWLQRELIQRGRAIARVERAQSVLDTLFAIATDVESPRAVSAAKTWLDWVNRTLEPSLDTDISEMSDEDLLELAQSLVKGL
jgi:hypothetical protein